MAQAQNPKIEELRFRLKTDPKSRLFYPLAEELRKVGAFEDGEKVLRAGLQHHPTYLSAWVSLGRMLREQQKNDGAVEALIERLDREINPPFPAPVEEAPQPAADEETPFAAPPAPMEDTKPQTQT